MKKILFTMRPLEGSCGGGMFFLKNMVKYLDINEYKVVYNFESDIDVIFIMDPRRNRTNHIPIEAVEAFKASHPSVRVIHRVNESDIKRPKPIGIEPLLLRAMRIADVVIFVSSWLRDYYVNKYKLEGLDTRFIINGCDRSIFYPKSITRSGGRLRIVTHHWSNNIMKGFHVYNLLDHLIGRGLDVEFIYIGRYMDGYNPKNITLHPPCTGVELADKLRSCDIYITGTRNEPGAMHYVEGLSCGLPVLYSLGGGGVHEVCDKYGYQFDASSVDSLMKGLNHLVSKRDEIREAIDYEYLGSERCCKEYLDVINSL